MHGAKDAEISTLREANATLREHLAQSVTLIGQARAALVQKTTSGAANGITTTIAG